MALIFSFATAKAQDFKERDNKARIYLAYGLNRTGYDLSNLKLEGKGYDFNLTHFNANDGFENLDFATFNAKLGFFITKNISVSVGYDNFTYKQIDKRLVKIGGTIDENSQFGGTYFLNQDVIKTSDDFIQYSYSKLSYINLNLEINDDFWVSKNGKFAWSYYFGLGGGVLLSESEILLFGADKATTSTEGITIAAEPVSTNNGLSGFGGNGSFGTRFHFGPVFLDLGGKAGYMRNKDVATDANGGVADHTFLFATGIGSLGLSFKF
jgi:hypothetical protein